MVPVSKAPAVASVKHSMPAFTFGLTHPFPGSRSFLPGPVGPIDRACWAWSLIIPGKCCQQFQICTAPRRLRLVTSCTKRRVGPSWSPASHLPSISSRCISPRSKLWSHLGYNLIQILFDLAAAAKTTSLGSWNAEQRTGQLHWPFYSSLSTCPSQWAPDPTHRRL